MMRLATLWRNPWNAMRVLYPGPTILDALDKDQFLRNIVGQRAHDAKQGMVVLFVHWGRTPSYRYHLRIFRYRLHATIFSVKQQTCGVTIMMSKMPVAESKPD